MSTQFTPGPWDVAWYECKADQHDADELKNGVKAGDVLWRLPRAIGPISASHSHWGGTLMDIDEADAHLIAAAPMLYEALDFLIKAQRAKDQHEFIDGDDELGDEFDIERVEIYATYEAAWVAALAALKAARGES